MSHTNTYIVATTRNKINKVAIVSSGNSTGAAMKFLFHTYHTLGEVTKISSSRPNGRHITNFKAIDNKGDFIVTVTKINIREDFIPISDFPLFGGD